MADHLALPQPIRLDTRRAGGGGGQRPVRVPGQHGKKLRQEIDNAIQTTRPTRTIDGVDPAYVFKIRSAGKLEESALKTSGLQLLGDTTDWTYFVLAPGDDASTLRRNLGSYEGAGSNADGAPNKTFFDTIDEFIPYGRDDRRDRSLPADGVPLGAPLIVDVVAWPSDEPSAAQRRLDQIRAVLDAHAAAAELDADGRHRFTVLRARVDRAALDDLLDLPVVELIRLPLMPRLEPSEWRDVAIEELPAVAVERVAPIGLIDDEVMDHPLLPPEVVVSRAGLPADHAWLPPGDHGTMVAGLCAFGDVEACLDGEAAWVACGPIHAVRVLEPDPNQPDRTRFPTARPAYRVIEDAIRHLHSKHGVRIINLSVTDDVGFSGPHVSVWTESLDGLARELDIVIVVAAGNHWPDVPPDATLVTAYPTYLLSDEARVAEPGVAANVLTVGSIAHADGPQRLDGSARLGDRAVAQQREPSPFTRVGPGAANGVKPDVVERGGNWVLDDIDTLRARDHGVSVISLVRHDQRLFGISNGTSFAAPRVSRLAAQILARYPGASANLIRALIGIAATPVSNPAALDDKELRRVAGHGVPAQDRALDSAGPRVALTFEGTIAPDTVTIHPVPVPQEFARGGSWRSITVGLAFDPEVRRTRRDYLAGKMSVELVRNMDLDDIKAIWAKQPDEKALRRDLPRGRRRPDMEPGTQDSQLSTLQVRRLRKRRLDPDDGDNYYVVVKHTSAAWAGDGEQRYALVVALEDEGRVDLDLYALLSARLRVTPRARVRG